MQHTSLGCASSEFYIPFLFKGKFCWILRKDIIVFTKQAKAIKNELNLFKLRTELYLRNTNLKNEIQNTKFWDIVVCLGTPSMLRMHACVSDVRFPHTECNIRIFWDVIPCKYYRCIWIFLTTPTSIFKVQFRGSGIFRIFQNVGNHLPHYVVSHPIRLQSSAQNCFK